MTIPTPDHWRWLLLAAIALLVLPTSAPTAAPINYGDFAGGSVMYLDVTETANTPGDDEPLFGPPSIIGNVLDFDPAGFAASATDATSDLTNGQLNFTLLGLGHALTSLRISESGFYSLEGTGSAATLISFGAAISATLLEVDGVALPAPVALPSASASGGDDLGNGSDVLSPWSLGILYDISAALGQVGITAQAGATRVEFAIDNALTAISEPASIAFIDKKNLLLLAEAGGAVRPVPLPASAPLLAAACVMLLLRAGRPGRAR